MAQYYTDFSEFSTNHNLMGNEWTNRIFSTFTAEVKERAASVNGKVAEIYASAAGRGAIWTDLGTVSSTQGPLEVLFIYKRNSTNNFTTTHLAFELFKPGLSTSANLAEIRDYANLVEVRVNNTNQNQTMSGPSDGLWVWMRAQRDLDGSWRWRGWRQSSFNLEAGLANEPTTWATRSDTLNNQDLTGLLGIYLGRPGTHDVLMLSVGTDGDPALEGPAPTSTPVTVESDTATVTLQGYDAEVETPVVTIVNPGSTTMTLAAPVPEVITQGGVNLSPDTAAATGQAYTPDLITNTGVVLEVAEANISVTPYAPNAVAMSTIQYGIPDSTEPTTSGFALFRGNTLHWTPETRHNFIRTYGSTSTNLVERYHGNFGSVGPTREIITRLSPMQHPQDAEGIVRLQFRMLVGGWPSSASVQLIDGATGNIIRQSSWPSGSGGKPSGALIQWTLTDQQIESITDWENIQVRFTGGYTEDSDEGDIRIYYVRLFAPLAPPNVFIDFLPANSSIVGHAPELEIISPHHTEHPETIHIGFQTHDPEFSNDIRLDTAEITIQAHAPSITALLVQYAFATGPALPPVPVPFQPEPTPQLISSHGGNPWEMINTINTTRYLYGTYPDPALNVSEFHLTPVADPVDMPGIYRIEMNLWRSDSVSTPINTSFRYRIYDLETGQTVKDGYVIENGGSVNRTVSWEFTQAEIDKVSDWSRLKVRLTVERSWDPFNPSPSQGRIRWFRMTVPYAEGSTSVRVPTAHYSLTPHTPDVEAISTIPDPAQIKIQAHPVQVFPESALVERVLIGRVSSPFFQIMHTPTKTFESGWPNVSGPVYGMAAGTQHLVVTHEGGNRVTVFNAITKSVISGFPILPRVPYKVSVSPTAPLAAIGTRLWLQGFWSESETGLRILNLETKQLVTWPTVKSTVLGTAFSPDGTKLAVACTRAPYLRVFNVATKTLESGYPELPGMARDVRWVGNRLVVAHRGRNGYSVINEAKNLEGGWPELPAAPHSMAISNDGRIAFGCENKLAVLHLSSKVLSTDYPEITNREFIRGVSWLDARTVMIGSVEHRENPTSVKYIDVYDKKFTTVYPPLSGHVNFLYGTGTSEIPPNDINLEPLPPQIRITAWAPTFGTVQEIEVGTANISFVANNAEASTPDIMVPIPTASISLAAYPPAGLPAPQIVEVASTKITLKANPVEPVTTSPKYRFISADDTSFSARDAKEATDLDLGSFIPGGIKTYAFRIGNTSDDAANYSVAIFGNNQKLIEGIKLSTDRNTWSESITVRVRPNEISNVIYLRVEVPQNAPIGDSSFLLDVQERIGVGG